MMDAQLLARHIIRRRTNAPSLDYPALHIASELTDIGGRVPADDWLILGGSLARGEMFFLRTADDEYTPLSDVDLLYIHYGDTPSTDTHELVRQAEKTFSKVDFIVLSLSDYRRLHTVLGYEYKNLGVSLTERALPPHDPVTLDARDCYEMLLFYIQSYFGDELLTQWIAGTTAQDFHLTVNKLCMKVLRTAAMLQGAHCYHDLDVMDDPIADWMSAEIAWRTNPALPVMDPGRFWEYLQHTLGRFDAEFGRPRTDAVACTRYAVTSSGRIIGRHQQIAHELGTALATAWTDGPRGPTRLETVKRATWERITGWTGTRIRSGPEEYFQRHRSDIFDHLLAMKVQV
ncbi:hypothetical protein ACIA8C_09835 [Nocardia sp. NPDC051321]|uniref:hypothetical protein n=1 Tax=Nocardia sp. NPDC051321 TaxID=3364323 RepID=UPI0037BB4318